MVNARVHTPCCKSDRWIVRYGNHLDIPISFLFHDVTDGTPQFDSRKMDPINELEDDDGDFNEAEFRYCVFPGLEKFGDEVGGQLEIRNVLLKARVALGPRGGSPMTS